MDGVNLMSGFDTTLDVLTDSLNHDAPRVLGHVLTRGDPRLRRRTVEWLIASKNGRVQSLLVRHFRFLGTVCERLVYENVGRIGPGLRAAMSTRRGELQKTVVEIVRDVEDCSLAYLAGEATASSDERVRALAVDVLWRWARDVRREEMSAEGPVEVALGDRYLKRRRFVLEGLQRAFSVQAMARSPRILRSVAMLADHRASWFWSTMGLRHDTRRQVLMRSLEESLDAEMYGFLVRGLQHEGVGSDIGVLLDRSFGRVELESLLREFARLGPATKASARRLRDVPWLGAGEASLEALPANLVATAQALAVASDMPRRRLAIVCRGIAVNHAEADARRVATETLIHCGAEARDDLRMVAQSAPSPSAALAVLHLVRRGELNLATEREDDATRTVGNLLRDWWELSAVDRREIGRGLTPTLRAHADLLRHHLIGASRTRRAAVDLVRQAQVGDVFNEQLRLLAADDSDTRIQSAALTAAAESLAGGVSDILQQGLNSWDSRVRANAIEALDHHQARDEVFLPFASDDSPRVRANVAVALLGRNRDEGRDTLEQLLTGDERERVSGLWAFSKTHPEGFLGTAERLARQDPSPKVRTRASELLASA
jgi:HEAT repeats